jgi:hypothetical protein
MLDAVMQRDGEMLRFHLTVMAKQEGRQWSAWCPELEVAAQGDPMQVPTIKIRSTREHLK